MADYESSTTSQDMLEMAAFAGQFAATFDTHVRSDPLIQWSRRWEYPFALEGVRMQVAEAQSNPVRILDAGSGFTFFPFLLAQTLPRVAVTCVDARSTLRAAFEDAAARGSGPVEFRVGDLATGLPERDGAYDTIVCLSVLEHIPDRDRALVELHRLLRPGGVLLLSFDVAIDGDYPIPVAECEQILTQLADLFEGRPIADRGRLSARVREDVLTTRRLARREPWRLPWRDPIVSTLSSMRRGYVPRRLGYRNLTVWCGRLHRDDAPAATGGS